MREIKFRAWDKEEGEMLYDNFCFIPTSPSWGATRIINPKVFESQDWFDCAAFDWADGKLLGGSYKIMQYTGLKDKNGKEIYEGDILLIPDEYTERILDDGSGPRETIFHLSTVRFQDGSFGVNIWERGDIYPSGFMPFPRMEDSVSDLGIIGNIYENPELLEVDK